MMISEIRTFRRQISKSCCTVALNLDAIRLSERDEDIEDTKVEQVRLQLFAQRKDGNRCRHFRLHGQSYVQNQLLALLHSTGLQDELLVLVRASSKVAECRNSVTLNLIILCRAKEIDKGSEETGFDDGRLVRGVDGDVSYTRNGGENKWEVGRLQKAEERRQTACANDIELVALV